MGRILGTLHTGMITGMCLLTSLASAQTMQAPPPHEQHKNESRAPINVLIDDPAYQRAMDAARQKKAQQSGAESEQNTEATQVRVIDLPRPVDVSEKKNTTQAFVFQNVTEHEQADSGEQSRTSSTVFNQEFRASQVEALRRAAAGKK